MACHTLNVLARRALDTLARWNEDLDRRSTAAQAAWYDIEHTPSDARERRRHNNDVVATRVVVAPSTCHAAIIRNIAGTLIQEHQRDTQRRRWPERNADAVAAWRLVLRTNNRDELFERVRIAARATLQVPN